MINKLFIIGNGFDIGHEIGSDLGSFLGWFYKHSRTNNEESVSSGNGLTQEEDEENYTKHGLGPLVAYLLVRGDSNWDVFEKELYGYKNYFSLTGKAYEGCNNCFGLDKKEMRILNSAFLEWIDSLSYPDDIKRNPFLDDKKIDSSLFLTFNYTTTLEDIYNVPENRVFHAHGKKSRDNPMAKQQGKIKRRRDMELVKKFLLNAMYGSEEETSFLEQLREHSNEIKDIYSWGFSFSDNNLDYIERICESIDSKDAKWHLYFEDDEEWLRQRDILLHFGFRGSINELVIERPL